MESKRYSIIVTHPSTDRSLPERCPVCFEDETWVNKEPLTCGHWVHYICVIRSKSPLCPLCRKEVITHPIDLALIQNKPEEENEALPEPENISSYELLSNEISKFSDRALVIFGFVVFRWIVSDILILLKFK
jgi:hypothetical protein